MELVKNKLQYYDLLLDRISNYEERTDAIVPDAYPDIMQIVCATGHAILKDQSPQNDRLLLSGTVRTCVLYQPEDGTPLRKLEIPISFAHIEECKGLTPESICFVQCRAIGVDAHAVNSRKINIAAKLHFSASVYDKCDAEITENIVSEEYSLEILQGTHEICVPERIFCKEFTIMEDPDVSDCEGAQLIGKQCRLQLEEYRAMQGRAVLKGNAQVDCMMLQQDGLEVFAVHKTVPFTQIIDCEGLQEGADVTTRFSVKNMDIELREDGIMSVGIHAEAQLCVLQKKTLCAIRDLYHTKHQLHVEAKPLYLRSIAPVYELHTETTEEIQIAAPCRRIVELHGFCYSMKQDASERLRLDIQSEILFFDADMHLHQVFRAFQVEVHDGNAARKMVSGDIAVQCIAEPSTENTLRIRVLVDGALFFTDQLSMHNITAVEIGALLEPDADDTSMIVRYVQEEENIWEIAKNYHTTVRAIHNANAIRQEKEKVQNQMILIPICDK